MADRQTIQKLTVSEKLLIVPNAQVTGLNVNHVQGLKSALDRKIWLESPAFTGTPTAPTPNSDADGNQIANAEFVNTVIQAAVDNLVGGAPGALDTLKEISDAINNDVSFNTTVTGYLAGKLDTSADEFGGNAATASDAKPGSALAGTLSAGSVENNSFTVYGENCEFYWHVTGKRKDINVEPLKDTTNVKGSGPYKWIE